MNSEISAIPATSRYFEDYTVGMVSQFGHVVVKQSDILEFALRFDPQPFHTDPAAAKRSPYGGVIASGWHTGAMMMRLLVEHYLSPVASLGSPGIDELRWTRPVRPGDVLSVRVTVSDRKRSKTKPDRGLVHLYIEVLNQAGEAVMNLKAMVFMLCRAPQDAS